MLRPLVLSVGLALATAAAAAPEPVSGRMLEERLPGATIDLDTPVGTRIPIRFSEGGLVSGYAGTLATFLGSARDRGRWWVKGNRLCMKWFRWFDAESRCMTVKLDGTRVYWRKDDGESGTATLIEAPRLKVPEPVRVAAADAARGQSLTDAASEATDAKIDAGDRRPPAREAMVPPPAATPAAKSDAGSHQIAPTARPELSIPAPAASPAAADRPTGASLLPLTAGTLVSVEQTPAPDTAQPSVAAANGQTVAEAASPAPGFEPKGPDAFSPVRRTPVVARPPVAASMVPTGGPPQETAAIPAPGPGTAAEPTSAAPPPAPSAFAPARPPLRPVYSFRVVRVAADDRLNVRSGPSEYHMPVGIIPPFGRGVEIVGPCRDLWCPIRHGRLRGWVNRYYLALE